MSDISNPDWETATSPRYDAWRWGVVHYQRNESVANTVTGYIVISGMPNHNQPIAYLVKCVTKERTHEIPLDAVTEIEYLPKAEPDNTLTNE